MSVPTNDWAGNSGKTYRYWIYPIGAPFKDAPANYIYAKQTAPGSWRAVYIGQTASLEDRLADHEKETCARRHGATHIHVHTSSDIEAVRMLEERELIIKWKPICNERLI